MTNKSDKAESYSFQYLAALFLRVVDFKEKQIIKITRKNNTKAGDIDLTFFFADTSIAHIQVMENESHQNITTSLYLPKVIQLLKAHLSDKGIANIEKEWIAALQGSSTYDIVNTLLYSIKKKPSISKVELQKLIVESGEVECDNTSTMDFLDTFSFSLLPRKEHMERTIKDHYSTEEKQKIIESLTTNGSINFDNEKLLDNRHDTSIEVSSNSSPSTLLEFDQNEKIIRIFYSSLIHQQWESIMKQAHDPYVAKVLRDWYKVGINTFSFVIESINYTFTILISNSVYTANIIDKKKRKHAKLEDDNFPEYFANFLKDFEYYYEQHFVIDPKKEIDKLEILVKQNKYDDIIDLLFNEENRYRRLIQRRISNLEIDHNRFYIRISNQYAFKLRKNIDTFSMLVNGSAERVCKIKNPDETIKSSLDFDIQMTRFFEEFKHLF